MSSTVAITLSLLINELPPANGKGKELNRRFPFDNGLNKIQADLRTKKQKSVKYNYHDIHK